MEGHLYGGYYEEESQHSESFICINKKAHIYRDNGEHTFEIGPCDGKCFRKVDLTPAEIRALGNYLSKRK